MGIVKPIYKVIVPKAEGLFELQWEECFNELVDILQSTGAKPFRICVFIHVIDDADCAFKSDLIRAGFNQSEHGKN